QQRLQAIHFLKRDIVGSLRALITAGGFVELLLRNQVVLKHLPRAAIFAVGVEEVGLRTLDRGNLFRVGGRQFTRSYAKLRANLANQTSLAIDFKLELLGIENDQRLILADSIALIGKHLGYTAFYLRAQGAFFQRV